MATRHESWHTRTGFILATIGSAVGIGSIWKFPYEVGSNGGGAFVLLYLLGLVLIVVPLMLAEFAIGRRGQSDAALCLARVAVDHGKHGHWAWIGILGIVTGFLILSFYSVIGGWTIAYSLETALLGLPGANAMAVKARYDELLASPWKLGAYHAIFIALATGVVVRGVSAGIENAMKILMPVLAALLITLAIYSIAIGDARATLRYLFWPDIAHFNLRAALEALGLGFFSIGVGMGLMITYAGYARREIDLLQVAWISVAADTAISLIAGFTVFPIVFANQLDPASGPGLVMLTLPLAFAQMPWGTVFACAFFVLLFAAALSSAISMLEAVVALLTRSRGWQRTQAAWVSAGLCWLVGLGTVFSFNRWSTWFPFTWISGFEQATFYETLDYLTSNVLLPAGGLALAIFAGWKLPESLLSEELRLTGRSIGLLRALLRYAAPAGIIATILWPLWNR